MKVDTVLENLQNNKLLDKKKIYIYASINKIIGGVILSAIHEEEGEEKLHLLMVDNHILAGAKLY